MFTSDHGEMAMEHRQFYKTSLYEGSARVPLIVSGPGFAPNSSETGLTSLIDIYPTLLDAAKIKSDTTLDGLSLLNVRNARYYFHLKKFRIFPLIDPSRQFVTLSI